MGRQTGSDFLVDTNGHCFICLSKGSLPQSQSNSEQPLHHGPTSRSSVHALSQYLKMDMSKVFHEKESIPSDLLDNVKRAKLKVSLCGQCSKWNDRISTLCRQLEKIKTEVAFYVGLIHEALSEDENNKTSLNNKLGAPASSDTGLLEKMRIVNALRTEAMDRCSLKLSIAQARVKVQNFTAKQVFSKRQRMKRKRWLKNTDKGKSDDVSNPLMNFSGKNVIMNAEGSDIDRNDYLDDDDGDSWDLPLPIREHEDGNLPNSQTESALANSEKRKLAKVTVGKTSSVLPPARSDKKLTYAINPITGKFKCDNCLVESAHKQNLKKHYESVHLKIKYKCSVCEKEFGIRSNYIRHNRTAHVGVRYKCDLCGQCFTTKYYLRNHQRCIHLGNGFQCQFCSKSFTQKCNMATHVRLSHRQCQ